MKRIFVVIVASLLLVSILSGMALAAKPQSLTPKFKVIMPKKIYNGLTPAEKKQIVFDNMIPYNGPMPEIITPWTPVYIDIQM